MICRRAKMWFAFTAVVAAATACTTSSNPPPKDLGPPVDVAIDSFVPADLVFPDLGPRPDLIPGHVKCGGSRGITVKKIPKGTPPTPCGTGCKRLSYSYEAGYSTPSNNLEVAGHLLVYSAGGAFGEDILYVDLKTETEYLVHDAAHGKQSCDRVATDGARIGYSCTDHLPGTKYLQSLRIFDPTTGTESDLECMVVGLGTCIPSHVAMGPLGFAVNIGMVTCAGRNVHLHRYADKTFTNVSQNTGRSHGLSVFGNTMVWADWPKTGYQRIVAYDIKTTSKKVLGAAKGHQFLPRIEGHQVVWMDTRNDPSGGMTSFGNTDIYHHDLNTGKTTVVTNHPATQERPDVQGDWVVWTDWRNNPKPIPKSSGEMVNGDIYARNLKSGKEYQVTNFKNLELYPVINQGKVYFRARIDNSLAIFVVDLKQRLGLTP